MKIGAIVQARYSSTRLPGKVLMPLPFGSDLTVLHHVANRLSRVNRLDAIVVATSESPADDAVAEVVSRAGVRLFRGSEHDVLARYYHAAKENSLDVVVRITCDCPCIDPAVVDELIMLHMRSGADYTSNALRRTYPHGLDAEVFSYAALARAHSEAREPFEREHVTPYINRGGRFTTESLEAPPELRRPDIRITLDTKEDYALLCAVFDFLYTKDPVFSSGDIVRLFIEKPWLSAINASVVQKKVFQGLDDELREAVHVLRLQDLHRAADIMEALPTTLGTENSG